MRQTPIVLVWLMFRTARAMASSSSTKQGALIFLHGLGDSPAGWSSLERALPQLEPRLAQLVYRFPPAPTVAISINGGMRMPGWFDLYDWPIDVGAGDDREGKLAAVEQINAEIAILEAEGIDRSKIMVGGFSQGGAIALLTAYRSEQKLAGCAALSAWLTLVDDLEISPAAKTTPCFWAHGRYDDKVLFEQQAFGINKLKERGVAVEDHQYPMGHESCPEELQALAKFLDRIFFSDADKEL